MKTQKDTARPLFPQGLTMSALVMIRDRRRFIAQSIATVVHLKKLFSFRFVSFIIADSDQNVNSNCKKSMFGDIFLQKCEKYHPKAPKPDPKTGFRSEHSCRTATVAFPHPKSRQFRSTWSHACIPLKLHDFLTDGHPFAFLSSHRYFHDILTFSRHTHIFLPHTFSGNTHFPAI